MKERTDKFFLDYNEYRDRPFGLKWKTAFALDELMQVIEENRYEEFDNIDQKEQMSCVEIDRILQKSFTKGVPVAIQLSYLDPNGQNFPWIEGIFQGSFDGKYLLVSNQFVLIEDIWHIRLIE